MGGTTSQPQSTSSVEIEVRLERPCAFCPGDSFFFAELRSLAMASKYMAWGIPQVMRLVAEDDVIAVNIFSSVSEEAFDRGARKHFADIYIPVDLVRVHFEDEDFGVDGKERVLTLGIHEDAQRLGEDASPSQIREAFTYSCQLAREYPTGPHVCVGIRRAASVPGAVVAAMPGNELDATFPAAQWRPAGSVTTRNLSGVSFANAEQFQATPAALSSPSDLRVDNDEERLKRLQERNRGLRGLLGLPVNEGCSGDVPEAEERFHEFWGRYRLAVHENLELKRQRESADKAIAATASEANLGRSKSFCSAPPSLISLAGDEADRERRSAAMAQQIREIANGNVELITCYDAKIQQLKSELANAVSKRSPPPGSRPDFRWDDDDAMGEDLGRLLEQHRAEQQALSLECDQLGLAISHELAKRGELERKTMQKLQLEREVQVEEIDNLRRSLHKQSGDEEELQPPCTAVLNAEADQLRQNEAQLQERRAQEQLSMERLAGELRRETQDLREELRHRDGEKATLELELTDLRRNYSSASAAECQLSELRQRSEELAKEVRRSGQYVHTLEAKVQQLRAEAEDISERVQVLGLGGPRSPPAAAATAPELVGVLPEGAGSVGVAVPALALGAHAETFREEVRSLLLLVADSQTKEDALRAEWEEVQTAIDNARTRERIAKSSSF